MADRPLLHQHRITQLAGRFAVARLNASESIPIWADGAGFASITRTRDELSIVCAEDRVPADVRCERGFIALKVEGPLPFDQVGVLVSLAAPIADAGVSIIAIGTFDTDYVLVRATELGRAVVALVAAGHRVDTVAQ